MILLGFVLKDEVKKFNIIDQYENRSKDLNIEIYIQQKTRRHFKDMLNLQRSFFESRLVNK